MKNPVIEVSNLNCKSGKRKLLNNINWSVNRGEHWVVYGMNGCGKTTLLSIIAGYRHFTSGSVKLFQQNISNENILDIRKRIGWVSASFFDQYYTKEAVLDIVLSGKTGTLGLNYNITLADVRKAKALLANFHLEDKIYHGFDLLSKGQRQNVLIARALMGDPEILILDEPCTGLDVYNRGYLFQVLDFLNQQSNITVIYVTHYVEEIQPMFQKALLLHNGVVYASGDTKTVFNSENLSAIINHPLSIENKEGYLKLELNVDYSVKQLSEVMHCDGC